MAKHSKRLSVFSGTGPDPEFRVSEEDFQRLEDIYGHSLSSESRASLISHGQDFVLWRRAELNRFSRVRALFESLKKAISGFRSFAYGDLLPASDARSVLDGILDDHIGDYPVKIKERDLLIRKTGSKTWEPATPEGEHLAVRQSRDSLMEVAISLAYAIDATEKDIAAQEADDAQKGFVPGTAFHEWLSKMRGWAKHYGFRYGPLRAGGSASRFSKFLFEINKLFPVLRDPDDPQKTLPLKEPVASVEALADRLRIARHSAPE